MTDWYKGDGNYESKAGNVYLLKLAKVGFILEASNPREVFNLAPFECVNLGLKKKETE